MKKIAENDIITSEIASKFLQKEAEKMKRIICAVSLCVLILVLCSCTSKEIEEQGADVVSASDVGTDITVQEEEEQTVNNQNERGKELLRLLEKFVDVQAYEERDGFIDENRLDHKIDEIMINDQILRIGMSYDDVLAAGFVPTEEDFPETELSTAVATRAAFVNGDGQTIWIDFIPRQSEEDQICTVAENGQVYSVYVDCRSDNVPLFHVEDIDNGTNISEVLEKLGTPYSIGGSVYSDRMDVSLQYRWMHPSVYVNVRVDLETEEILGITVEGYTE